jgi:serine/threonine protein kinase
MRQHMGRSPDYYRFKDGKWLLWVVAEKWKDELWPVVLPLIEKQPFSKHPQTLQLNDPNETGGEPLFLKVFHGSSGLRALKDIFRDSKALRSMRQAVALSRFDFNVPITVAAGEKRKHCLLRQAFVLTIGVNGRSLPVFLKECAVGINRISLSEKRRRLEQLAIEVRRLHELGFVHGDLVPTNILVAQSAEEGSRFFFIDNDRTRYYARWVPRALWRRNLVQLNRMPLPGITLQDRLRFLKHYLGSEKWAKKERHLLSWLERKTRQRRKECDLVDSSGSFRQLMRWHGELT